MFTDPTPSEAKFLIPFDIGESKIRLYGSPSIMAARSELMKSLLDKIELEGNVLAPQMKVNKNSLIYLWTYLNGLNVKLPENTKDLVEIWPLLNYFDVNSNDPMIENYIESMLNNIKSIEFMLQNSEYNALLDDMLKKVKIIYPWRTYYQTNVNSARNKIERKHEFKVLREYSTSWAGGGSMQINDTKMEESLESRGYQPVINSQGIKYYKSGPFYFTDPIWDGKEYAMYQTDAEGNRII